MWHLFLDESGDLGFDFVNKSPSRHFTVCILATSDPNTYYAIRKAVKTTLRRKINRRVTTDQIRNEIKATETHLADKRYFFERIQHCKFGIYAVTLNKHRVYESLIRDKDRVYNFVARLVLDHIPFEKAKVRVRLTIDKSKGADGIREFNDYIVQQLKGRLDPNVPLDIYHLESHLDAGLQATDLFAWGIFRKYEKQDTEWYNFYSEKVIFEDLYFANK
jgi:hypothetical protein